MKACFKGTALVLVFLVFSTFAQTNLALNKTVTASSVQTGNVPANAVDGSMATRWCASDGTVPQWLMVDLGASNNLTNTEIYWEKNLAYKYKIETSPDNVTWTQRVDRTTNTTSQQTFDDNFTASARYIRVTCTALPSGNWVSIYEFRVYGGSVNVAPQITTQPVNRTVTAGQTAAFSVVASGTPVPTYQWRKNSANISGATTASYITPITTVADNGAQFSCVVSNAAGSVTSAIATLTVLIAPPKISTQPSNTSVTEGLPASFSIVATGSGTLAYQWYRNATTISGATSASYTIAATAITDSAAGFSCMVSNSGGSVTSASAVLTVQRNYRRSDSLALVAFYNSTGGPNWVSKTNWLTGQPIDTWQFIAVQNNRVVSINFFTDNNNVSGTLPTEIGQLTGLSRLAIGYQSLQGPIPREIGNLVNLTSIALSNNRLTGKIPGEIGNLARLQEVYFINNQLTDTIPATIGNLTNLITLALDGNQFTGQITSSIGNLSNLTYLNLSSNLLTGEITSAFGNLRQITNLNISNNRFTGSIPSQFGNLSQLQYLNINSNLFSNLPSEITNLNNLITLDIHNNQFCNLSPTVIAWANAKNPGWLTTQTCSPPQVQITANLQSGNAPLSVQFTATNIGPSSIDSWSWTFGDGATNSAQSPSHTYSSVGTFTARLIVQGIGGLDTASLNIQANPGAPIVHMTASPQSGYAPLAVNFSSTNTGGAVTAWSWNFGDGTSSAIQNPQHTYSSAGTFKAIVSGTNVSGTSRDSLTISVTAAQLPVISSNPANIRVNEGQPAVFTVMATGTSPLSYQWKKGATNIGSNSSSFSIPVASASDAGAYWVIVSNAYGMDTSTTAMLTVLPIGVKFNNEKLSVSGNLYDASGNPVGATRPDTVEMTVLVINRDTGGAALYSERFLKANNQGIIVDKGTFAARLGEGTTLDSLKQMLANNPYLWVQIIIEGATPDTLKPRTPLTASAQAMIAGGAQPMHGTGDPTANNVNAIIGAYYINDTNGSTWLKINSGWRQLQ